MIESEKQLLITDAVNDFFFETDKYIGLEYDINDSDSMLEDAIKIIKYYDFKSLSLLKRVLRIEDNRAVRIFTQMHQKGLLNDVKNSFFNYYKSEIFIQIDKDPRKK